LWSSNGTASVVASGGLGEYRYQWSNGGETATINNLRAGIYTDIVSKCSIVIIDSIEGFENGAQFVTNSPDNQLGLLSSDIDAACSGDTIYFDPTLMNQIVMSDQGEILIDKALSIIALGMDNLYIDASSNNRIFHLQNGVDG